MPVTNTRYLLVLPEKLLSPRMTEPTYQKSCPMGRSWYALPLSGKSAVSVECAVSSDAVSRLAAHPSFSPSTWAAPQAPSTIQQPATSPKAETVSQATSINHSPTSVSQTVSNSPGPRSLEMIRVQGAGLVAGGIDTPAASTIMMRLPCEARDNTPTLTAIPYSVR
jgi:hypothetical protein